MVYDYTYYLIIYHDHIIMIIIIDYNAMII